MRRHFGESIWYGMARIVTAVLMVTNASCAKQDDGAQSSAAVAKATSSDNVLASTVATIATRAGLESTIDPEYQRVLAARLAVEYWADHDYDDDDPFWGVLDSPRDAAEYLKTSRMDGANTRRFYTYERLVGKYPDAVAAYPMLEPLSGGTSGKCAAPIDLCKLTEATRGEPQADIRFEFKVKLSFEVARKLLDPQSWDEQNGTKFKAAQRTFTETCPAPGAAPAVPEADDDDVGSDWQGTLFEHYEFEVKLPPNRVSLKHMICFDCEHVVDPPLYRIRYEVCPELAYENQLWGVANPVKSGLEVDEGCTWAEDPDKDGELVVGGVKSLKLTKELCGQADQCTQAQVALLPYGLKILAEETSIAFAVKAGGERRDCKSPTCNPPERDETDIFLCANRYGQFQQPIRCGITRAPGGRRRTG